MSRLLFVVIYTGRFEEMKAFYSVKLGLGVAHEDKDWLEFDTEGTTLALHRMSDPRRQGISLSFEADSIERQRRALARRGVDFAGGVQKLPWGSLAGFWDTEGNPVALVQTGTRPEARGRSIDSVILSCRQFAATAAFYRERVGLSVASENGRWIEFDTGAARLAVHPRFTEDGHPPHGDQSVAIAFRTDDLMEWAEELRARNVRFVVSPVEEAFGLYAEVRDPDGHIVLLREPPEPQTLEERLAEAYEDDGPNRTAIRKPAQKGSRASVFIARPGVGSARRARKQSQARRPADEKARSTGVVVSPRGTGVAGARKKPKRKHDPKRARSKPAVGRLKKAERRTLARHTRAVAKASKKRSVKGASSGRRRTTRGSRARSLRGGRR